MEIFIDREDELQLIDDSFTALLSRKRLVRSPIIEVQGVSGIGKTSLLRQVEERCRKTQLRYLWVDVRQNPANVADEIVAQVKKYIQDIKVEQALSPIDATKSLLSLGPVVLLLDAIDSAYESQLEIIESLLQDLVDDERLFVVLTSKKIISFQQKRAVARKLTTLSLKPFSREYCDSYLDQSADHIDSEGRDLIFAWSQGYPLAIYVMVEAINQGLDHHTEQGKKMLLSFLNERVINQEILASIPPDEQERYQSLLRLLAVPRRFNLIIMQDLIETFNPEQQKASSVAYFGLPREINDATDILNWRMERAGFSIDEPIRSILLLLLKIEHPERYFAIHGFLADANLRYARDFSGADRVRYIRECLYHMASNTSLPFLAERLAQPMRIILQESPDVFLQFAREFDLDSELKEALEDQLLPIQATIDAHLQEIKTHYTSEG